jgi:hypothetical protein
VVADAIAGSVVLGVGETATLTGSTQDPNDSRNWVFTFSAPLTVDATANIGCARVP